MPRTGTFGGFAFDPEVFSRYMSENATWNDAIIASGVLAQDNTIMDLIGEKGNVAFSICIVTGKQIGRAHV